MCKSWVATYREAGRENRVMNLKSPIHLPAIRSLAIGISEDQRSGISTEQTGVLITCVIHYRLHYKLVPMYVVHKVN